jgi:sialic acid synthase SpsE
MIYCNMLDIRDFFKRSTGFRKPYLIAEAGVNHEGSMELAKRLINEAKEGGADAIKFQTYKADTIASKNSPAYWDLSKEPTTSQHELFSKYDKFWKAEYEQLAQLCRDVGIEFMSTPFDIASAKFLNELMPVIKISSSDLNNLPFIDYLTSFGKPIILSTGASYMWEIQRSVELILRKDLEFSLLHCILNYPTMDYNANLGFITQLRSAYPDIVIGYSDHTLPNDMKVLEVATLLGSEIIEKHFTHDKSLAGNDHYHAMDKEDLKRFNEIVIRLEEMIGDSTKEPLSSETQSRLQARRSVVAARNITKGQIIEERDLTCKRPGSGISVSEFYSLIGKKAVQNISEDTVVHYTMLD